MAEAAALLAEAARVWAKAQVVFEGPSWDGQPAARVLVERLAADPTCHDGLLAFLASPSQLVAAHALQTLELAGNSALAELPDELCGRREQVSFHCGSFRNSMDLGGYARAVRKRARRQVAGSDPDAKPPYDP